MKGIVVTTDLEIRIEEFSDPLYKNRWLCCRRLYRTR